MCTSAIHRCVLLVLIGAVASACAKRLELPDLGPQLPYTAKLELAPSVAGVRFEYTDNCGHLRPVPVGHDLEEALIETTHRLFTAVAVENGNQVGPPDVIIRIDLVDSALKLQTDNVYDRVPAEVRFNGLVKVENASGQLLREPDIAVTRQERLRIEPLQKNCEYIFEPFLSNAIVEFAARYAAETRSVFEPATATASSTNTSTSPAPPSTPPPVSPLSSEAAPSGIGLSFKAKILDENGNMILESGERVKIHVDVVNGGTQVIQNIAASVSGHEMLTAQFPATTLPVGTLQPGDTKSLDFVATLPQSLRAERAEVTVAVVDLTTRKGPPSQSLATTLGSAGATREDVDFIPTLAAPFQQPDNYLVAVGLASHRDPAVPTRKYAGLDAQMVSRYFQTLGGLPAGNVRLLQDRQALRSDLEEALLDWLPAHSTANSTVVVYFGGQALVTSTGETFLIPYDGSTTSTSRLYPLKDLEAALSRLKAKQKVFLFDGSVVRLDGERSSKAGRPSWDVSGGSTVHLIGTTGIGKGHESETFRHGLFTYAVLRGLRGGADTNRNGEVTVGELVSYVVQEVPSIARTVLHQEQRPQVIPLPPRTTDQGAQTVLTKPSLLPASP